MKDQILFQKLEISTKNNNTADYKDDNNFSRKQKREKPAYEKSKFHIHRNGSDHIVNQETPLNLNLEYNKFYVLRQVVKMNKKFGSCLPLWTNLMGVFVNGNHVKTISNAPVECWFKIIKLNKLHCAKNLKASRFV